MAGKVMKVIGNVFTVIIILIVSMSLFSLIQYRKNPNRPPSVFGYSAMSVLTGSMRPYLEPGDMIIDKAIDADEVKVGDVLTYRLGSSIVTHRGTEIIAKDGNLLFETRGDANGRSAYRQGDTEGPIWGICCKVYQEPDWVDDFYSNSCCDDAHR